MVSKKKQSEGIALLSMYNDEEDDDMDDVEDHKDGDREGELPDGADARIAEVDLVADTDRMVVADSTTEPTPPVANDGLTPEKTKFRISTPQQPPFNVLVSPQEERAVLSHSRRSRRGTVTIVDYGQDEVAISPEPEEGEFDVRGQVMVGNDLQTEHGDLQGRTQSGMTQVLTSNGHANSPQFSEPSRSDTMNQDAMVGSDSAENGGAVQEEQKFVDPLHKFLPPPPEVKCSEELQRKINKFLDYKKAGKSFNAEVRNRKDYRNPDFLLHAVRYQDIDQIGSCFSKDVFDPHGYDPSDFYDEIEADMRRESDRKEQEKKKAQKVEFISGGTQPGILVGATKINIPVAGSAVTASASHLVPSTGDTINRDGRPNKKSKWDKVDGDQKNPPPSVGQDSVSTARVRAAISANAGGGYMQFAQKKRREAEEKRSSERKLESRS